MNQALAMRIYISDSYRSIERYLHLVDFYKGMNYQKSKENALQAYAIATKYQSMDGRLEALTILMSYNQEKGINRYAVLFVSLDDSIKKVWNNAKNQFAKIRYDSRKANLESVKYKGQRAEALLQLSIQKSQKYLLFFGFMILLGGIGFIINYYKSKTKHE
ncbi:hypothetical protein [uncultured Flavobacterium sp.]|uniref:hypothetical protein n=1 Tax=uncultured Flavobacterium sp. TaxID=165435 RepID=UPI0030ED1F4A